ncbi:hypothetical protein BDN67DRAFT_925280 [Paxillus ammoniavirescens]|nr:hypothetical protein BDN67DRAFT_925280 [Paxillus ammoniavirescens]
MSYPSSKSPEPQHDRRPPVDMPHNTSSSGQYVPTSPAPPNRFSLLSGTQTSLHDEPSPTDPQSPHPILHTPHGGATVEAIRSKTPLSIRSTSQKSVSHRSMWHRNFVVSIGRASQREHDGLPATTPTSTIAQGRSVPAAGSSSIPGGAAPDSSITHPGRLVAFDDLDRPGGPTVLYAGPRFVPMSTHNVVRQRRYTQLNNQLDTIRKPTETDYTISAMLHEYPGTQDSLPQGWTAHRHPQGVLYFMHEDSKTFTEVDMYNELILEDIEYFRRFLFSELRDEIEKRDLSMSLNCDELQLVLEPMLDGDDLLCGYYFVNPGRRSLFWLDDWDGEEIFRDCRGDLSLHHKGLAIQSHYWRHWDLFPNLCKITQELKDEVVDMILHATCDHLTWKRSPCPLNVEDLQNHLSIIDKIDPNSTYRRADSVIIIGRIMHTFYHTYFLNFYGEECARLSFDQTIHGWKYKPSWLMATCAPLLFMAPMTNVRSLHRMFDGIASKDKRDSFINKLDSQLADTNLLATVLLGTNVGFLSIQSVDNGGGTTFRQLASYMSLVASMTSIVLGLVFVGHHRSETRNTALETANFLSRLHHERHGFETLGIIYSLSHAFLLWGMVLFFVAFMSEWCEPGDIVSWTSVGSSMSLVALPVVWCIWTSREQTGYWWFQPDPDQVELGGLLHITGAFGKYRSGAFPPLGHPPESHATLDTTRPQDADNLLDSTPHEDRAASNPVNITQATSLSLVPST